MPRSSLAALAALAALAGCRSPSPPAPGSAVTSEPPRVTATGPPPGEVVLTVTDLVVLPGQPVVVLARSTEVALTVTADGSSAPLRACAAGRLEGRDPADGGGCTLLAEGRSAPVAHGPDLPAVEISTVDGRADVARLSIAYRPAGPGLQVRLSELPPGTRTTFVLSPAGTGPLRATATWGGPAGPEARLTVGAGAGVVATAEGGPPLEVSAQASPAATPVVTLANSGAQDVPPATLDLARP